MYKRQLGIQDALTADVTENPPLNTSYGFTGRELDRESGLMLYRARYYDPSTGRFLQKDPEPGKLARPITVTQSYAYVGNNPFMYTDSSGRIFGIDDLIIAIILVYALVGAASNLKEALKVPGASFGQILGSTLFGAFAGAINGIATVYGGPWAGNLSSFLTSGLNNAVNQAIFTGSIDVGEAFKAGVIGGVLSAAGHGLGKLGVGKFLSDAGISVVGSIPSTIAGSYFVESGIPVPKPSPPNCNQINSVCYQY